MSRTLRSASGVTPGVLGRVIVAAGAIFLGAQELRAADPIGIPEATTRQFLAAHCFDCHDQATKKGGLDLESLSTEVRTPESFRAWVKVHDRFLAGNMPPAKRKRPPRGDAESVLRGLDAALTAADRQRRGDEGRTVFRRLNRTEYEQTLRDLLGLPGLQVREMLPEDGRAHGFDKVGTSLDISFVQLGKYLEAADAALDMAIAPVAEKPRLFQKRLYPAFEYSFAHQVADNADAVLLKNGKYDGDAFPLARDEASFQAGRKRFFEICATYQGAVGIFRHTNHDTQLNFGRQFHAHYPGRYRLKFSVWGFFWERGQVKPARKTESVGLLANGRLLGYFDAPSLKPTVHEAEVWLNAKESVEFNAASLWPFSVPALSQPERTAALSCPGIAFDWLEVEGPLFDAWPSASHRRLFGDLRLSTTFPSGIRTPRRGMLAEPWFWPKDGNGSSDSYQVATVTSTQPLADAQSLLAVFLPRAFRRPVSPEEVERYVRLVQQRLTAKVSFEDAMRTAYKAALCSPNFLYLNENPGRLDDWALASRLSYFLWGSMPDDELLTLARQGKLRDPETLHAQTERLLSDAKAGRFVVDFVDQWLQLREINATTPDAVLYPEFSTSLRDAMVEETRAYFREMLDKDLGVAQVVQSDFAMLNQRLAEHYGIPGVDGAAIRRVALPAGVHRGGFLTQASVLKVTANGTTTTPVKRGVWMESQIVGRPPEPPPADVPAIEPDVRGATTIREQLAKHRSNTACASCHAKFDPPGFALESYDVIGGFREKYRALSPGQDAFHLAQPVDPSGKLADGRTFADIGQLRRLLEDDERQLARNLVRQLAAYATGGPVGYADRPAVEAILERCEKSRYGLRSLILELVQSQLFQEK